MNEYRRMQYLDAMGIEMFIPRKQLPGGKPSVALTLVPAPTPGVPVPVRHDLAATFNDLPPRAPEAPAQINTKLTTEPLAISPLLDEVLKQKLPSVRGDQAAPEAIQPNPASAGKNIRFSLNIWSLPAWLIIDTHHPHSALPTENLLHNLLWSVGIKEPLPKTDSLHWPMVANAAAPAGLDAAREMMTAFVATKLNNFPVNTILLLGQAAFDTCTSEGSFADNIFTTRPLGDAIALILPSLAQLLTTPHLKATTWQALNRLSRANV